MNRLEFLRLIDRMGRLWPQSGLSEAAKAEAQTLEVWFELLGEFPAEMVRTAIDELARSGERYAPPPGVVYQRAEVIREASSSQFALAPIDATREPTPEERERAERWRSRLRSVAERLSVNGHGPSDD